MATVAAIMAELKAKGTEKTRITYSRHGIPYERALGVSNADMKLIAKTIKREQALAMELYATGVMEAMYLAGLVASGVPMTKQQLQAWADGADGMAMIADHTVPWVTVENAAGREMAKLWIGSKEEYAASTGWRSYSGLMAITPDDKLDLKEIEAMLKGIPKQIHTAPNRTRSAMNGFIIHVGYYVTPLLTKAKEIANIVGPVSVDVGDTDCKVSVATESIAKAESMNRVGAKRKTIRC